MSVELQKLRSELMRECLAKGWTRSSDLQTPWTQLVAPERLERWFKRLYTAPDAPLASSQRLVNHFKLGADPEFVFTNSSGQRCDAQMLRLKAGPAWGADNNARLVELRPAPSRSVLEVLASLWLAMRWMAAHHPDTLKYSWRGGAYFEADGLGGHVHFGRKRLTFRDREAAVLDRITHLAFTAGVFDREEGRLRVRQSQGAPAGQPYGALSDIRPQPHGFEYRTLPSWIDNPWLAYWALVISKLVVAYPDLVPALSEADANLSAEQARGQLRFLLAYFSPLDDDARLAFAILQKRGWPAHAQGFDIKQAWGLFAAGPFGKVAQPASLPAVQPTTIPARPSDMLELATAMFENRVPEGIGAGLELVPTWQPNALPAGYHQLIGLVNTKLAPGLGEFAMDLCFHESLQINLTNCGGGRGRAFCFGMGLEKQVRKHLAPLLSLPWDWCEGVYDFRMNSSKDFRLEDLLAERRAIVDSGVYPIWFVNEVQPNSLELWKLGPVKIAPKPVSKSLLNSLEPKEPL